MRHISSLVLTIAVASTSHAQDVTFEGVIGTYAIEAELTRAGDEVVGRYRYGTQQDWLDLVGDVFGRDAIQLSELLNGEQTGAFFLDVNHNGLVGFWAGEDSDFPVQLKVRQGAMDAILDPIEVPDISESLTGRYDVGGHWVNDWFAPNYEIGFNGGSVQVVQTKPDEIYVEFDFIVGPTYHFASFRGVAQQTEPNVYLHNEIISGGSDPCRLVFTFNGPSLSIEDKDNGYACQFGARAHANFDLTKMNDTAEFGGSW